MLIKFKSDATLEGKGWKISYFSSECKYGYTITDTAGVISDGSEDCNYKPSTFCKWTIAPPDAEAIEINFTDFDLAANGYDNVRIFKDYASSTTLFAELKNDTPPTEPIIVPTGTVVIIFSSSGTANGWKFKYKTTTLQAINENKIAKTYLLYPNPTGSYFYIESKNMQINTVNIFDITGKTVKSILVNNTKTKIDVNDLDRGVYFVKFNNITKKIILR
jgi:hypothetical protein